MPENSSDTPSASPFNSLDLGSLTNLSLGPTWGSGKLPESKSPKVREDDDREHGSRGSGAGRRDRRGSLPARREGGDRGPRSDGGDRGPRAPRSYGEGGDRAPRDEGRGYRDRGDRGERELFQPVIECDFYPEDAPFKALTEAIRKSCRTFELFELARLILEKPDRFVCVAKPKTNADGTPGKFYATVAEGLPFETEADALNFAIGKRMDEFLTAEEVEVEAPAGNFLVIHKCGFTGELIGPPNYHRYQILCEQHLASRLPNLSMDRFRSRLESVRDPESIKAWQDKMRKQTRFVEKAPAEGQEAKVFDTKEAARTWLTTQLKDKLVRPAFSARFGGKAVLTLDSEDKIRRSLDFLLDRQRRFPLDTANHLRGRLRRLNFAVYKKGSKGVSFICAIKRRFREPGQVLAEHLNDLISFIEAHPNVMAPTLPKVYLGIEIPEVVETAPAPAGTEAPAAPAAPVLRPEDADKLRSLKRDLHYLVSNGYVIEYSDGRLYAPPPREAGKPHADEDEGGEAPDAAPSRASGKSPADEEEVGESTDVPQAEEPKA